MRGLLQDVRFGLRLLSGSPGFTAVAVLTLALGIAANTTVFSWIDSVLLRPYHGAADPDRLAVMETDDGRTTNGNIQLSYRDYLDYRQNLKSISGLTLHREDVFSLNDSSGSQAVWGELVAGNYFDVLGVKPVLGRTFSADEDGSRLGAYPVAVVSYALWHTYLHGDPKAVGRTIVVNRRALTVIGVASPEFHGTMPGLMFHIWVPLTMGKVLALVDESVFRNRADRSFYGIVRLRPGVSVTEASAESAGFAHNLEKAWPKTNRGASAVILPPWRFHSAAPDLLLKPLRILMAVVLVVLLIVCANVANLLLARSLARRRELSIRLALGAGGGRLSRQLFTETMLLAVGGALAGLLLTPWIADLLPAMVPKVGVSVAAGFQLNGRILGFTIAICVLTVLVSGAAPVLFWMRSSIFDALKEGGRSGRQGPRSHRLRGLLVTAEVALATLVLIGAGLFVRSLHNARGVYPGFDKNNVVLLRFYPAAGSGSTRDMQQFCVRLRERLSAATGVAGVTYADEAPLGSNSGPFSATQVEGFTPPAGVELIVNRYLVAPGYFDLLHVPLLEGRDFTEMDNEKAARVVIVNRAFAQRYFGGGEAIGRKIRWRGKWATVVGVARDCKYYDIAEAPRPVFFAPFKQEAGADNRYFVFLKTSGDPARVMSQLRREVAAVDAGAGAFDVMTMADWMEVTMLPQTLAAGMMTAMGLLSLALAAVGLYSVMAYSVAQRTQEIGIRMALGAQPGNVLKDIIWQGACLTIPGLAAGIFGAFVVTRLVSGMLIEVSANDPATFAGASLFLALVALAAAWLPARRATHLDPMVALRCE